MADVCCCCCRFPSIALPPNPNNVYNRPIPSSASSQKLSFPPRTQLHHLHGLSTARCVIPSGRSRGGSTSDSPSSNDDIITDTRRKASSIKDGVDVIAFYVDHNSLPQSENLDKCHATRLILEDDKVTSENLLTLLPSPLAAPAELSLVYDEGYIRTLIDGEQNKINLNHLDFTWSHELVTRSLSSTGGAIAAMHVVMLGLRFASANISGHGFLNQNKGYQLVPSGIFDDIAVAVSVALQSYPQICNSERPVLVINLDVCQTESKLSMFENDNRVVTFNLHGRNNDSSLLDCTGDDYYLATLSRRLDRLFELHNPSLVFYQAGVDALSDDVCGKLSMTRQGLLHRNNIVYTFCFTRKTPLVITMGSGYSNPYQACIEAHADVYRTAALRYGTSDALKQFMAKV